MSNGKTLVIALLLSVLSLPVFALHSEHPPYLEQEYQILGSLPPQQNTTENLAAPPQFYKHYQKRIIRASTDQERAALALTAINYWRNFGKVTLLKSRIPDKAGVLRYRVITEHVKGNYQILFTGNTTLQYQLLQDLLPSALMQ